jgi:hypothetical protein
MAGAVASAVYGTRNERFSDEQKLFTQTVQSPIPLCAVSQSVYTNYRITPSIVNTCSELRYGGFLWTLV